MTGASCTEISEGTASVDTTATVSGGRDAGSGSTVSEGEETSVAKGGGGMMTKKDKWKERPERKKIRRKQRTSNFQYTLQVNISVKIKPVLTVFYKRELCMNISIIPLSSAAGSAHIIMWP